MHNFTAKDVADPAFDLSQLAFSEEDILGYQSIIRSTYDECLQRNRKTYAPNVYYHNYVSPHDLLAKIKLSESAVLSFVFIADLMKVCVENTPIQNDQNFFTYKIRDTIRTMPEIGNRVFSDSPYVMFSSDVFGHGFVSKASAIEAIRTQGDKGIARLYEHNILSLLDLISPEDAKIFLNCESEKVRISAYRKLGCLEYIDRMLLDKSAEIRRYAADIMDYGDPRFKSMVKEKTKGALYIAINKSPAGILPLFLSNPLLKKDHEIKAVFERRMGK